MNKFAKIKLVILYTLVTLTTTLLIYLLLPPQVPLSPLALNIPPTPPPSRSYVVYGFLPYWNLTKLSSLALSSVTHLTYFTLHLNGTGQLVKLETRVSEDPGFTNYKRILQKRRDDPTAYPPLLLTFMPYDQDALTNLLLSRPARAQAISSIQALMKESSAAGLNIDFEPVGGVTPELRRGFTSFVTDLRLALCSDSTAACPLLSVSIYPSAASRPRLWELAELSPHLDHFVVMTYDYHLPGGLKAGPNSPLRGAGELFQHDILTNLAEITSLVPSHQILLGIPFYGYEWSTDSSEKYSPTQSRGSVASLERIESLIKENTLELLWDRNSLTPYAIRREEDKIVSQIYYESVDSIKLKLELVRSAGLGGIAIWALGYEGHNPALWQTISTLLEP